MKIIQPLELLIVEDDPAHLADAQSEMRRRIDAGIPIRVEYASTLSQALQQIATENYDGIICDILFPSGFNAKEDTQVREKVFNRLQEASLKGRYGTLDDWELRNVVYPEYENAPLGVAIAETLPNTPIVFCTSTHHHGKRTEPFNRYYNNILRVDRETRGIPYAYTIIDSIPEDGDCVHGEASHKNWKRAYQSLMICILQEQFPTEEKNDYESRNTFNQKRNKWVSTFRLPEDLEKTPDEYQPIMKDAPTGDALKKKIEEEQ